MSINNKQTFKCGLSLRIHDSISLCEKGVQSLFHCFLGHFSSRISEEAVVACKDTAWSIIKDINVKVTSSKALTVLASRFQTTNNRQLWQLSKLYLNRVNFNIFIPQGTSRKCEHNKSSLTTLCEHLHLVAWCQKDDIDDNGTDDDDTDVSC